MKRIELTSAPALILMLLIIAASLSCRPEAGRGTWKLPVANDTIIITTEYETAKLSDFFSYIEYIILETNEESIFSTADKVIANDSLIYIFDAISETLLLFSRDGKFINRYWDHFGRRVSDFDLTPQGEITVLLNNRIAVRLDKTLNPVSDKRLPFLSTSLIHLKDNRLLFFTDFFPQQLTEEAAQHSLMLYDLSRERGHGVLPVSFKSNEGRIQYGRKLYRSDYLIFGMPVSDQIVSFTGSGLVSAIVIDHSSLTSSAGREEANLTWIEGAYIKEGVLRFEFSFVAGGEMVRRDFLYHISDRRLVSELINDYNGFLGLTPVNGTFPNGFTGVIYPLLLKRYSEEAGEVMPEELRYIPEVSNPVITFYHMKK